MIKRLWSWITNERKWHREHHAAWELARIPGPDGFSPFQKECERRLNEALAEVGSAVVDRTIAGETDRYVTGKLRNTQVEIWIYLDGAQLSGPDLDFRLEDWDARTPDELCTEYSRKAVNVIQGVA